MSIPIIGGMPTTLVHVSDSEPGFTRIRRGRGFSYHDDSGRKLTDGEALNRIKSLGIPPIWSDVWIAKDPCGHLQCTGYDLKKRKQYIYHEGWNTYRSQEKFSKMASFGRVLPSIRQQVEKHLQSKEWPRHKVLALVIRMLDEYHIRIGNEYYRQQNETYGLTTLRRKHFDFEQGTARLEYKAKSGKYRKINIKNGQLAKLIKQSSELRGYELFKYRDKAGNFHRIDSNDVNEYLKDISGEDFTCKDFRTWGGTTLAIEKYEPARAMMDENPRLKKLDTVIIKLVAKELGNTQSVCRQYYVHPKVLATLMDSDPAKYQQRKPKKMNERSAKMLSDSEVAALNIIS